MYEDLSTITEVHHKTGRTVKQAIQDIQGLNKLLRVLKSIDEVESVDSEASKLLDDYIARVKERIETLKNKRVEDQNEI